MRLIHDGPDNEVLLEGGQEIGRGQSFEVDDERGRFLLATQPVPLREGDFQSGGVVPQASIFSAVAAPDVPSQGDASVDAEAPDDTQREASSGEAQSTEGDAP